MGGFRNRLIAQLRGDPTILTSLSEKTRKSNSMHLLRSVKGKRDDQWRSQPNDSDPLCKYCHVYKLSTQSISKEMNNNELKFA